MTTPTLDLFGPGDCVRVIENMMVLGHCGHQYAFEGGYQCFLQANETYQITMSKLEDDKRQYAINAVDTDGVTRTIWLAEQDIRPAPRA